MGAAETAALVASLELNTKKFDAGVRNAGSSLGRLSGSIAKSRAVAVGLGVGLEHVAAKGLSELGNAIGDGIQGALTLEKAQAQTQAVIESTGRAAGVTAQQVRDLANATEDVTTVDDKTVQQAENLLLTFTNIGKNVFPQATAAATNMAIAFNKGDASTADIDSAAIQLGKALNDPAKGFAALKRSGVSFSDAQIKVLQGTKSLNKEQLKHYQTLRKTDKAAAERYKATTLASKQLASQRLILAELDKEFGKAGKAAGTGFAADISRANDAIDDAKINIAQGLLPALGEVAKEISATLKDPAVQTGLKNLGTGIGDAIKGLVAFAKTVPWGTIASSLQAAAGFAKDLLNAFLGLPSWVQTAVITGWGLNKLTGGALSGLVGQLASGLVKGVLGITAGVVKITAASVVGGGTGVGGPVPAAAGKLGTALSAVQKVFLVGEAIGLATAVFDVQQAISAGNSATATQLQSTTAAFIANNPDPQATQRALDGVNQGIHDLEFNPLNVLVQGDALDKLRAMREDLKKALDRQVGPPGPGSGQQGGAVDRSEANRGKKADALATAEALKQANIASQPDIEALRGKISDGLGTLDTSTVSGATKTSDAARNAGVLAANASRGAGATVVQAIWAARPITTVNVQVTGNSVATSQTTTNRGGQPGGDRTGTGHAEGHGPLAT